MYSTNYKITRPTPPSPPPKQEEPAQISLEEKTIDFSLSCDRLTDILQVRQNMIAALRQYKHPVSDSLTNSQDAAILAINAMVIEEAKLLIALQEGGKQVF